MKVRLVGFELELGSGVSLGDFETSLKGLKQDPKDWRGFKRVFRCRQNNGLFEGLFLTIKDQKTFPVLRKVQEYEVKVHQLAAGEQLIDFNHFAWCQATRRGLYQHYHQSPALSQFGAFLEDAYAQLRKARLDKAISALGKEPSESAEKKVRSKFKGSLNVSQIVSQAKLKELIDELDSVDRFQVDLVTFEPDQGTIFDPIKRAVKRQRHTLLFEPDFRESSWLKNTIRKWVSDRSNLKKGFVEGREGTNPRKRVNFDRNYDYFGEYDFESVAKETAGSLSNWENSAVLKYARQAMSDHSAMFLDPEE